MLTIQGCKPIRRLEVLKEWIIKKVSIGIFDQKFFELIPQIIKKTKKRGCEKIEWEIKKIF